MKFALVVALAILPLGAIPAAAQTRVQVSIGVRVPPVHGQVAIGTVHPRAHRTRVVVVRRGPHGRWHRGGIVVVRPERPSWHGHSHHRHHRYH